MEIENIVNNAIYASTENLVRDITEQIALELESQPYSCTCSDCGADLEYTVEVDGDQDLVMEVDVCECQENIVKLENCTFVCDTCGDTLDISIDEEEVSVKPCVYCNKEE